MTEHALSLFIKYVKEKCLTSNLFDNTLVHVLIVWFCYVKSKETTHVCQRSKQCQILFFFLHDIIRLKYFDTTFIL